MGLLISIYLVVGLSMGNDTQLASRGPATAEDVDAAGQPSSTPHLTYVLG